MGATLYQHPSAPVEFQGVTATPTPDSIAAAFKFNCDEREKAGIALLPLPANVKPSALYMPALPTDEEREIAEVTDGLSNLIQKYGAKRVARWVRNLATVHGQEV